MTRQPKIDFQTPPLKNPHAHVCINFDLFSKHMLNAVACCQMLYNQRRKPVNFRYILVNAAYTRLTGLHDVEGKTALDILPCLKKDNPEIFEYYGKVARTGQPVQFEVCVKALDIWLTVSAHCPHQGYFISIFDNITHLKRSLEAIERQKEMLHNNHIALSSMIEQVYFEKQKIKDDISHHIAKNISPLINKIKLCDPKNTYVDLLKKNVNDIVSDPSPAKKKVRLSHLSAREREICQLIQNRLSSKEIASLISISEKTVTKHRMNIRKKLGITNQRINLSSYLYHMP